MSAPAAPPVQPVPRWGVPAAVAIFFAWIFGAVVASVIAVVVWGEGATDNPWAIVLTLFGQSVSALVGLAVVTIVRGQRSFARDFGFRAVMPDVAWLPVGMLLQIVGTLIVFPLTRLAGQDDSPQQLVSVLGNSSAFARIALVVMVAVFVPVVEELMFRGILLRSLMRHWSAPLAVLADGVLFGAVHLLDPGAIFVLPVLVAVGVVAAWLTARTGRLGPAIALHAGFNLVAVIFTFLA